MQSARFLSAWLAVFFVACAAVASDTAENTAVLNLHWDGQEISLSGYKSMPGKAKVPRPTEQPGESLLIEDANGASLSIPLKIPRTLRYDFLDPDTGRLSGGAIVLDEVDFAVRVPWLPGAKALHLRDAAGMRKRVRFEPAKQLSPAPYPYQQLVDNGPDNARAVLVVVGDGYRSFELEQFRLDAQWLVDYLLSSHPWHRYRSYINVYAVEVTSTQSGADHPSQGVYVDTALDSTFETSGIERLLTVSNVKALSAASSAPTFDAVLVVVNDDTYGGSGGSVAVSSTHPSAPEVVVHEMGHITANLADEYEDAYPGYPPGDSEPNVTFETVRSLVKWEAWISPGTPVPTPETPPYTDAIGLFEGARYLTRDIYRPKQTCKMRTLDVPFCEVCAEAHVLALYNLPSISPIESTVPGTAETVHISQGQPAVFEVKPLEPSEHALSVAWELDGVILTGQSGAELSLDTTGLARGTHTVACRVSDPSEWVRTDREGLLSEWRTWQMEVGPPADSDNDGISDPVEGIEDEDGDTIPNYLDDDSDGDGLLDSYEGEVDTDGDTRPNYRDTDSDDDGLTDREEGTGNPDGDSFPNYIDKDSDADGYLDVEEREAGTSPYDPDEHPVGRPQDIDESGSVDAVDVQLVVNAVLGIDIGFDADTNNDNSVDAVDVQRVINSVLFAG